MTHVEHITSEVKLNLRLKYQSQVYMIIMMHTYFLKEL